MLEVARGDLGMKWSWLIAGSNGRPDHELVMTLTCDHSPDWKSNTHDRLSSWAKTVHMVRGCVVWSGRRAQKSL